MHTIDLRGAPHQICWGCGQLAGGRKAHVYYGNFPFGVEHMNCGVRIETILDRSLRALSALDSNSDDRTKETVLQALITSTARSLGTCTLNTILEDLTIRRIVETKGMEAALSTFRAISQVDDLIWDARLKDHNAIMRGPELIQRKLSSEDTAILVETENVLDQIIEKETRRNEACKIVLERIVEQAKIFSENSETPYCILRDVIASYCVNANGIDLFQELIKKMDALNAWKVIFLGRKTQDPAYKTTTHIIVDHIALLPSQTHLKEAQTVWQEKCVCEKQFEAVALPTDCLKWKNHWVFVREIKQRVSFGEGGL